jgi:hypothetical protein
MVFIQKLLVTCLYNYLTSPSVCSCATLTRESGGDTPDAGVFGLLVCDADAFVTLLAHQTVGMEVGVFRVGHQLYHHTCQPLVVTDLQRQHQCPF